MIIVYDLIRRETDEVVCIAISILLNLFSLSYLFEISFAKNSQAAVRAMILITTVNTVFIKKSSVSIYVSVSLKNEP